MSYCRSKDYGETLDTHHGNVCYALRSQAEVAKLMGISQNRVSQLERKAIQKIKAYLLKEDNAPPHKGPAIT